MLADIGYATSGVAYLLLLLLLFTSRQSGVAKRLLVLATFVTSLWSFSFVSFFNLMQSIEILHFVDSSKQAVWLLFLASCLRAEFTSIPALVRRPETITIIALPLIALTVHFFLPIGHNWLFLIQTLLALEVLVLLELVYRQAGQEQWAYKPLVLFLGIVHLYEFVLYANAAMFGDLNNLFLALRGFVYLLMAPFLILAIRRISYWGINIFVSREIVLHSSLLLVAGIYLFLMGLAGYAINYYGGQWGVAIQILMVIASGALLAALFLSNHIRTRIKIFITKHFFANQYDYRVEWVKLTKILSQSTETPNQAYQFALDGYLSALEYDQGMLLLVQGKQFQAVAKENTDALSSTQLELIPQIVEYCEKTHWQLDLQQFVVRPYDYPGLTLSKDDVALFRYQLIIPLFKQEKVWGVVLLNAVEREAITLNWEVRDYLTAITEQVTTFLFHHQAAHSLAENAQFAAFNRMSAFVLHDLKNVMAQIDLILCNAQQHKNNPEFIDDTFETLEHTKTRMDNMLKQLTEKKVPESEKLDSVMLSDIAKRVVIERCQSLLPIPLVDIDKEEPLRLNAEKVMNVLYHLLSNAQQATRDDGEIIIRVLIDKAFDSGGATVLQIIDNGEGMSQSFIEERLFTPFDTTKGNAGMGIGVYDARNYMHSIGGTLDVESEEGTGTTFTLVFPHNYQETT